MIGRFAHAVLASCWLLAACEVWMLQSSRAEESLGNPVYQRVADNLDAGGVIYLYWSAERALGEFDRKLASVRDLALADPSLSPDEKNGLRKSFDLGIRFILSSGLENVKAFGLSSREIEPGVFLNKTYTYLPDRSGFLWDTFAKSPHDFPCLKMLPENTEGFAFFDFNLAALWGAVSKELVHSEIPEVAKWQQHFSQQVQAFTGLSLEDLLSSLGDEVGIIVTLDPKTTAKLPFGNEQFEMPEPAAALVWKVRK